MNLIENEGQVDTGLKLDFPSIIDNSAPHSEFNNTNN